MTLHLDTDHLSLLGSILEPYLGGRRAFAFGSRVRGTHRPHSDLDVCIVGPAISLRDMGRLRLALEESPLPFVVDIVQWDEISERFRGLIEEEMVAIA